MALDVPTVLPLDAHERGAQWQRTIVLVALAALARPTGPAAPPPQVSPARSRPRSVRRATVRRGQPVRPPRSC